MQRLLAYLRLMRPANVITAMADVLAGFFAAYWLLAHAVGYSVLANTKLLWLLLATSCLYAGGIVFNDVFDAKLDHLERPERPIPSGMVSRRQAVIFGSLLFGLGFTAAYQLSTVSLSLSILIAVLCFSYNGYAKHHIWLGPINMGLCRAVNLLLGVSVIPQAVAELIGLGVIPLLFIGAVTAVSRGEVAGGNRPVLQLAAVLYGLTLFYVLSFMLNLTQQAWAALPFLLLFAWRVFKPLAAAWHKPEPRFIRLAVKSGVTSLIALDAALGAGFAHWPAGLLILSLLPISLLLAKCFAVT